MRTKLAKGARVDRVADSYFRLGLRLAALGDSEAAKKAFRSSLRFHERTFALRPTVWPPSDTK